MPRLFSIGSVKYPASIVVYCCVVALIALRVSSFPSFLLYAIKHSRTWSGCFVYLSFRILVHNLSDTAYMATLTIFDLFVCVLGS